MSEKDVLISRIVDREDRPADWDRLDRLAAQDHRVFDTLVETMRGESALRTAMGEVVAVADRVELASVGTVGRRPWLGPWSGWMAAAVIALIWIGTDPRMKRSTHEVETPTSSVAAPGSSEGDAPVAARLASGEVLRELPSVMVETRLVPDSDKVEVIYVRRTLQRAVVSDAYTMARDEVGQPFRARVDLTRYTPPRNY